MGPTSSRPVRRWIRRKCWWRTSGNLPSRAERVRVGAGPTGVFHKPVAVHQSLKDFECGLQKNDPDIAPSQIYAYAALKSGVPYANGAPNLTTDTPALLDLVG